MCRLMIRCTFGDRQRTDIIIPLSITHRSVSDTGPGSMLDCSSAVGVVGAVGDGDRTGLAAAFSSTPDSSGATVSAVDMEALASPLGRTTQLTGLA